MTSKVNKNFNLDAQSELDRLATNIRIARKRRKITLAEMADRSGVSTSTLSRLESADPTVSIAAIFQVLSILGLVRGISSLADPENDVQQVLAEVRNLRLKKRTPNKKIFTEKDLNF